MNVSDLPPNCVVLLKKALDYGTNEENYTIEMEETTETAAYPYGVKLLVTLTNKCSGESTYTCIKRNVKSRYHPPAFMTGVFRNEIIFYEKIWKRFREFQNSYMEVEEFTYIPHFYGCCTVPGEEQVLINDVKRINYQNFPLERLIDQEHLELIFKTYGRFHALSFAFNRLHPEEFSEMVSDLYDTFGYIVRNPKLCENLKKCFSGFVPYFEKKNADPRLIEKLKIYAEKAPEFMVESLTYSGKHPVLCHGDTWSGGQMMFRYHKTLGHLTNMMLVNFQMIRAGSPVTDLAYCFYSGLAKDVINNLEHFLKLYHDTLSHSLRQFDINAEEVYSYNCLKYEWKKYARFGFLMGLILWKRKNGDGRNDVTEFSDEDLLTRIRSDHILHMFQYDFL